MRYKAHSRHNGGCDSLALPLLPALLLRCMWPCESVSNTAILRLIKSCRAVGGACGFLFAWASEGGLLRSRSCPSNCCLSNSPSRQPPPPSILPQCHYLVPYLVVPVPVVKRSTSVRDRRQGASECNYKASVLLAQKPMLASGFSLARATKQCRCAWDVVGGTECT